MAVNPTKVDTTPDIVAGGAQSYTQALQRLALQASASANLANANQTAILEVEAEIAALPTPPAPSTAVPLPDAAAGVVGTSTNYTREGHIHPDHYQPYMLTPEPDSGAGSAGTTVDEFAQGDHVHPAGTASSLQWNVTVSAVSYTLLPTDLFVKFTGAGGQTFTLPTAIGIENPLVIRNTTLSNLLLATTGGQTIDGAIPGFVAANSVLRIFSDGSDWWSW